MAALKYWVWLTTLTGVSEDTRLRLLHAFSSPEDIYFADKGDLALVKDMKKHTRLLCLPCFHCLFR